MILLSRGAPEGHHEIVVIAYKWKCSITGHVSNLPVYMLQVGVEVPYYAKLVTFGFAVFTVTILALAVRMIIKANKVKDRGRQILSLGIVVSMLGIWPLIVDTYLNIKLVTGDRAVLDSFLCGWITIITTVLELVGSAMMIAGSMMIIRRKLTL